MFICTTVKYQYIKSLISDVYYLTGNMDVRGKRYREFRHRTAYRTNKLHMLCR